MNNLNDISHYLTAFAKARDWEQYHSPKNLCMALSVECAELMEHFQWLTEAQSHQLSPEQQEAVGEEIVDVLLYSIRLASVLNLDLPNAIQQKTQKNEAKYPVDKVKGSAKKYNQYGDDSAP
jgi:NTP pyrophosphatase (non-canonical NTP hydrolase)